MIDYRPHRLWLGLLALALMIGIGNEPLLGLAQQKAETKLADLRAEKEKTAAALDQLQQDIAAAEKMGGVIDDKMTDRYLSPVDRLRVAQIMEHRAAETHLSHLSYTLSPEQKISIDTVGSGRQELADSQMTLQADAPTDGDIYAFIDAFRRTVPGRLTLRHILIQRIHNDDTEISNANLHFSANGEWLSNGAAQNLAEIEK